MWKVRNVQGRGVNVHTRLLSSNALFDVQGSLIGKTYKTVQIGDSATVTVELDDERVRTFARITGDSNPIHLDDEAAKKSRFGRRIAHGLLVSSAFPTLFATCLPGSIYRNQSLHFVAPVYVGDMVWSSISVTKIVHHPKLFSTLVTCDTISKVKTDTDWRIVIKGAADVIVPSNEIVE